MAGRCGRCFRGQAVTVSVLDEGAPLKWAVNGSTD